MRTIYHHFAEIIIIIFAAVLSTVPNFTCTDPQYELVQCKEGWTRCDNGYECIPDYYWCDGREEHCSDNSDERGCGK